jgi:hypothetical protein
MLAQNGPRSFISGNKIDLRKVLKEYNRNEFHHIYPKNYLKAMKWNQFDESCFANICFLSRADNNAISGAKPSEYRPKLPDDLSEIEQADFLPPCTFDDDFVAFIEERSKMLVLFAMKLIGSLK